MSYVKNHNLVPKHAKLSEKDKKQLLEQYHITIADLPKIFTDDPAIQELDVKPGDVIKISRNSTTAGEVFFYRAVIEGV
ncbi:DNA-directed RNA polymerase subunit H [Candidatus Woesearchaeota archaeon]|nr:MAG: DNA-directed RNA polymerase subunit H [Candidatus Woesearchaeota archaeon]